MKISSKQKFILILIVILSLFIRLYNLNSESFGYGEIETYQAVNEYLKGNFLKNFYIFDNPPLGKYIFTAFSLINPVEIGMRLASVVFGFLAVVAVYFLARKFYGDKTALLAAIFTAFSIIHIQFSRYVQFEAMLSFFYVITFYFFFEFLEKRTNKNAVLLGISSALGFLVKFAFIYAILTIIILCIVKKLIWIKRKPTFSLFIDNKLLKALIVFIVVFFLIWPNSLYPINTKITINAEGAFETHKIDINIPTLLLAFGYRFTQVNEAVTNSILLSIPVIGHFFFFLVKESFIFIIFFFLGIYAIFRKKEKNDLYLLLIVALFFIFLWIQNVRYTYRYLTIIIPFLAIISARAISIFKKNIQWIVIAVIFIIMLIYALVAGPSYALYYNELQPILNIPESEGGFGVGIKDVVSSIANCSSVLTDGAYAFLIEYHYPGLASDNITNPDCVVKGRVENKKVDEFISKNNCKKEIIEKNNKILFEIYKC